MRKGWIAATSMGLLVLLAACGGLVGEGEEVRGVADGGTNAGSPAPTGGGGVGAGGTTGAEPSVDPSNGGGTATEPSRAPAACPTVMGGGDHVAQLVDVRVGSHTGYDRIVFEFAPPADGEGFGVPRFEARALEAPILDDPRGEVVSLEGSSFAGVVFHGASGVLFTTSSPQGYELTYDGPREFRTGFPVLLEAEQTGDFEATLSWAFGLSRSSCAEVSVLREPLRVVIDFPAG